MAGVKPRTDDLTLDRIVEVAIELLDEHGLDAFSMRSLGARLGCSAMAAYHHVPNREALLRLVLGRVEAVPPDLREGPWYERLERLLRDEWASTWPAHPWIVEIWQRGILDPRLSRRLDVTQDVYREAGFHGADLSLALLGHWSFVVGTLGVVSALRSTSDHMIDAGDDQIFEFNLATYLAGLRTHAAAADP